MCRRNAGKIAGGFEAAPQSERPLRPVIRDDYVAKAHRRLFCRRIFCYFVCEFFPPEMSLIRKISQLQICLPTCWWLKLPLVPWSWIFRGSNFWKSWYTGRHGPIYHVHSYGNDPMYHCPWLWSKAMYRSHSTGQPCHGPMYHDHISYLIVISQGIPM